MAELQQFPLVTSDGVNGIILRRSRFLDRDERNLVRLEDGREFEVSASDVHVRPDGSFELNLGPAEAPVRTNGAPTDELPDYHRPGPDGSVKTDQPLFTEEAGVERIPVNRLVDAEPQPRTEGDVTIIPVVEEVLVVEKRLLLKEEIHIRRMRNQVREPKRMFVNGSDLRVIDGRSDDLRL